MDLNLHPPLTAFPVALLVATGVLEIFNIFLKKQQLRNAIEVNLCIAAIASIAAFYSGYDAAEHASISFKIDENLIENHHIFGRILLFSVIPCSLIGFIARRARFYKRIFFSIYYLLLAISLAVVVYTGYLGGELVFSHGAGVKIETK